MIILEIRDLNIFSRAMIKNTKRLIYLFVIGILSISCSTYKPFYAKSEKDWEKANNPDTLTLSYAVFLTGDAGNSELSPQEPTLKLLESQLYRIDTTISVSKKDTIVSKKSDPKDVIIFMGDNIYDHGLPSADAVNREEKETIILKQLDIVKDFKGKKIFVPGNHDWNNSKKGGLTTLQRQEEFVEQYLNNGDTFIPSGGCPGPVELQLNNNFVIIVVDSEWWLHKHEKSAVADGCTAGTREQLLSQIKSIVVRNRGKNILFTQHHPLFSNGTHGGYFTLKDHLFPLTAINKKLYIPLPVIGSLYPLLRQYGVSRQDLANKEYQLLKNSLLKILKDEKNLVFAAGHEHAHTTGFTHTGRSTI
ncbi:MAG: metallophosphatase family protein [Sphingobacteriales bacterium]|nr:MAG: metallophosphatase family protein [Sphingobacteriales bacterium]